MSPNVGGWFDFARSGNYISQPPPPKNETNYLADEVPLVQCALGGRKMCSHQQTNRASYHDFTTDGEEDYSKIRNNPTQ